MSIPTSNLYDFVHQVLKNKFLIKYFYPWGYKNFSNLIENIKGPNEIIKNDDVTHWFTVCRYFPVLVCHDQEPLDFDMYSDFHLDEQITNISAEILYLRPIYKNLNLRWADPANITDQWFILHSELNSNEVKKYEDTGLFKCAYWWSHGMIARDWYRFAEYDQRLSESHTKLANWLVYARAATGKREYRKRFLDMLRFVNNVQLGSIDTNAAVTSNSSAEYNHEDHTKTNCSIVLETVFDNRIHLTEKTLRPIACGHPFMILSGPGTLKYLRTYGFKTFHPFIDESYDLETDLDKRMIMVLSEMDRINKLPQADQDHIWKECAIIARRNKELFFSDQFFNALKQELIENVSKLGMPTVDWKNFRKQHLHRPITERRKFNNRAKHIKIIKHLRNGGTIENFVE